MQPLTVVIPTRDRHQSLVKCLDALEASDARASIHQIIVVDDGSVDETPEYLRDIDPRRGVRVLRHESSRGPASSRNAGIRLAATSHVWMIDDDVLVDRAAAGAYVEHLRLHDMRLASVTGPVVQTPHGMTPFEYWSYNGGSQFGHYRITEARRLDAGDEHFCTANMVSPTALLNTHPFDETFMYPRYEDRELGYRLTRIGHKIHYAPKAAAVHDRHLPFKAWLLRFPQVTACALHFAELHRNDASLRVKVGIERAERLRSFSTQTLDDAVDLINRYHDGFFDLALDSAEEWSRAVVFASFRMIQEFFRVHAYRTALGLEELRDHATGTSSSQAMATILSRLRDDC